MASVSLLAAALSLSLAASQDPAYQDQIAVEWVLVPAVVRKVPPQGGKWNNVAKGGRRTPSGFVSGLEVDDFELRVDGRPVAIESFEARSDAPVSLIHLQDLSGSMALGGKIDTSRRMLACLLRRARSGDEYALATFAGGKIQIEVPFTAESSVLREAMTAWRGYGTTALHDAVAWLPDIAVRDHGVKRAALLITDGVDNASVLGPGKARDLVRSAQLPVYVLGLATGSPFELDRQGRKRHRYADVLNLLAHLTGGRYRSILGQQDVEPVCAAIDEELRSQYVLGFATGTTGSANYRSLEVKVRSRKVTVLHRRGYVGRLPSSAPD